MVHSFCLHVRPRDPSSDWQCSETPYKLPWYHRALPIVGSDQWGQVKQWCLDRPVTCQQQQSLSCTVLGWLCTQEGPTQSKCHWNECQFIKILGRCPFFDPCIPFYVIFFSTYTNLGSPPRFQKVQCSKQHCLKFCAHFSSELLTKYAFVQQ